MRQTQQQVLYLFMNSQANQDKEPPFAREPAEYSSGLGSKPEQTQDRLNSQREELIEVN